MYQSMMFNTLGPNDNSSQGSRRPQSPLTIQTSVGGNGPQSPQNAPLSPHHSPLSPLSSHQSPLSPLSPLSPSFSMQNLGLGMNTNGNLTPTDSSQANVSSRNRGTPTINVQIPQFYSTTTGLMPHPPQSPNSLAAYTSAVNTPLPPSPSPGSPMASMMSDNEMEPSSSLYCPSPGGPTATGLSGRTSDYAGSEYGGSEYGGDDGSHFFSMST